MPQNNIVIRKGPTFLAVLDAALILLFIGLGILFLTVVKDVPFTIFFFGCSVVPAFLLLDFLTFRVTLENTTVKLKRLAAPEKTYAYTDVSWKFSTPTSKNSPIHLTFKDNTIVTIYYGAKDFLHLTEYRHNGTFTTKEKQLLADMKNRT